MEKVDQTNVANMERFLTTMREEKPRAVSPLLTSMTVTKYSNFVETSKPFEMADFYKYSEKIRKTRGELGAGDANGRSSPAHSSASEHSSNRAPSPAMTSARLQQQHVAAARSRSGSPLTINMQQQSSQHSQHVRAQHGSGNARMRANHAHLAGDNSRLYAQHPSPASSPHVATPLHSHNVTPSNHPST